ncbi:MAG: hypothetical protein QNL12_02460, partial [Acidimicrobiia bacterium]|nr:hypothetical protein [Acidimicrobiia bacterium]
MKKLSSMLVVLLMALALLLVSVGAVSAKAPGTGDRTGDLDLLLNPGVFAPVGPYDGIVWYGTVEFDEVEYGIVYRTVPTHANEVASHWTETWEMYRPGEYTFFDADGVLTGFVTTGDPVVSATDKGMTHWKNFTWVGN